MKTKLIKSQSMKLLLITYFILFTVNVQSQVVFDTLYLFPDVTTFIDEQNGLILDWMANFAVKFNMPLEDEGIIIKKVGFLIFNMDFPFTFFTSFKISIGNIPEKLILFEENISIDSTTITYPEWQIYNIDSIVQIENDSTNNNSFFISGLIFLRTAAAYLSSYVIPNHFIFHTYNEQWLEVSHEYFPVIVIVERIISDVKDNYFPSNNFHLYQNHPNPFNATTVIRYSIANLGGVKIKIYNILGKEIATIIDEEKPAGSYEFNFEASTISSGIYIVQLTAGNFLTTSKMILLK